METRRTQRTRWINALAVRQVRIICGTLRIDWTCILFLLFNTAIHSAYSQAADVLLTRQSQVDSFCINTFDSGIIPGNLFIVGKDVRDLSNLSCVTKVGEMLRIEDTSIKNLHGLENIFYCEMIDIRANDSLEVIDGFTDLIEVYWFECTSNPILIAINGFEFPSMLDGIELEENSQLERIECFTNIDTLSWISLWYQPLIKDMRFIPNVKHINESLLIMYNDSIEDLGGLENLKKVGLCIMMKNNARLQNIDALNNLEYVGYFHLSDNPELKEIDKLDNLRTVRREIHIGSHQNLTSISGFQWLSQPPEAVYIAGNPKLMTCYLPFICDVLESSFIGANGSYDDFGDCWDVYFEKKCKRVRRKK